jgi:predicted MFS family arabinose efflux permease
MFATALAARLDRLGIHYGWVMATLAFLSLVCSSSAVSLPGVLIVPITTEFGWAAGDVGGAIALMFVLFAATAPFAAALMLRYGVTRVVMVSATLAVTGLATTTMIDARWHLAVTIGVCVGAAAGMVGLGLAATVASRWFVARRGLVVGFLTAGFAAGQLTFLPLAAWLSTTYGWRVAILPALIGSAVCALGFLLLGREWPANVGQAPYGETQIQRPPAASASGAVSLSLTTLREALGLPIFWIMAATFFICGLSSSGIVQQHFIPFCADNRIDAVTAASYLAVMGMFNFVGTIASGWLTDRFDNRALLAVYYGLRGLSLIYLPFSDFSVYALTVWAIFFGLDFVATVPPTVRLMGQHFGAAKGPVLFGWVFAAHQLGSAVAAYGSGVTRDVALSYLPAFLAAGVACLIAAALFSAVRKPRPLVVQPSVV